jgi:hypothetical protein
VLANLHAPVWWGAIMLVLGSSTLCAFVPAKSFTSVSREALFIRI